MGLTDDDRKQLEYLIKAATRDPKMPIGLARKMIQHQVDIEDFTYGLICGMIMGDFIAHFQTKNGRQPDKDETVDILSIMMSKMARLRKSIMEKFDMR
ncbi:MAG: hypothetical protein M3258_02550 [Thermoproteota archaeon]|jgi:hypothetical protein|nr:hypothetical protein [Thermoproteota archaeon]